MIQSSTPQVNVHKQIGRKIRMETNWNTACFHVVSEHSFGGYVSSKLPSSNFVQASADQDYRMTFLLIITYTMGYGGQPNVIAQSPFC